MRSHGTDRRPMTPDQQGDLTAVLAQLVPDFKIGHEGAQLISKNKGSYASVINAATREHVSLLRQMDYDNRWDKLYGSHFLIPPGADERFQQIKEAEPNTFSWSVLVRPQLSTEALVRHCEQVHKFSFLIRLRDYPKMLELDHSRPYMESYSVLVYDHGNFYGRSMRSALLHGKLPQASINLKEALLLVLYLHAEWQTGSRSTQYALFQDFLPFMNKPLLCLGSSIDNCYPVISIQSEGKMLVLDLITKAKIKQDFENYSILIVSQ